MPITPPQRERLAQLLQAGAISAQHVAELTEISRQAVHRWFDPELAKRKRKASDYAAILDVLRTYPHSSPLPERESGMRIVSQANPYKRDVLEALRRGKMDVKQAARKAKVSERSIRKWCEIHHVRIKAERPLRVRKPKITTT